MIFHSAGPIDGGWGVIDFWESRGQFDTFIEQRVQPALGQLGERGFPGPPEVKEFPVPNYDSV